MECNLTNRWKNTNLDIRWFGVEYQNGDLYMMRPGHYINITLLNFSFDFNVDRTYKPWDVHKCYYKELTTERNM
jgi:hypothetical protein